MRKQIAEFSVSLRTLFAAGVVGAVLSALSPAASAQSDWQAEWERVKTEARKEGKVVIAIPPNPALRQTVESVMKKQFGLDVELVLGSGNVAARRIADEHLAGVRFFDVAILTIDNVGPRLRQIGAIGPLAPHWILPEVKDPANWWGGHIWGDKEQQFCYTPMAYMLDNVWYNEKFVKADEIKSWDDLLDPKWKGKIGLFDPRLGGAGSGIWGFIWETKGEAYLRKLAAHDLIVGNRRPLADQLARGKLHITVGPTFYTFQQFIKAGIPLKHFAPLKEGTYVSVGNGGPVMMAKPPHPSAAKVFVNWLLSKEGQTAYTKAQGQATRRLDVDTKWMTEIGVRAAKDSLAVADFRQRENQSESRNAQIREKADALAAQLFK